MMKISAGVWRHKCTCGRVFETSFPKHDRKCPKCTARKISYIKNQIQELTEELEILIKFDAVRNGLLFESCSKETIKALKRGISVKDFLKMEIR